MLPGIFFILARLSQLLFLVIMLGMLSWHVNGFVENNFLAPSFVLAMFIVTVIASVWASATLVFYALAKHFGYLISLIDIGLFGGFIAGVYELRGWSGQSCSNVDRNSTLYIQMGNFTYNISKSCNMLKTCFAFGIIEILLFFWTALLGLWIHHHHRKDRRNKEAETRTVVETRERHHRHGSRSRSRGAQGRSRSRGGGGSRAGSRAPSRTRGRPDSDITSDYQARRGPSRSRRDPYV